MQSTASGAMGYISVLLGHGVSAASEAIAANSLGGQRATRVQSIGIDGTLDSRKQPSFDATHIMKVMVNAVSTQAIGPLRCL